LERIGPLAETGELWEYRSEAKKTFPDYVQLLLAPSLGIGSDDTSAPVDSATESSKVPRRGASVQPYSTS
jgi:hypothetical protein